MVSKEDLLRLALACDMGLVTREQLAKALGSQDDAELLALLEKLPREPRIQETLLEWKASARKPRVPDTVAEEFADGGRTLGGPSSSPEEGGLRESRGEKYDFKGELGRGGLGKVVEAVDKDFGREVAVKMMLPGQSREAVERFLLEGRAAGRLPHPNIVPIYEMGALKGEAGESPFFTMAKIVGQDLRAVLKALERGDHETRKRFNRPRLLRVFQEVCNAMAYAHHNGVVHRDLKPANIMVGDFGEVFVVDWGLAKVLGGLDEHKAVETRDAKRETSNEVALTLEGQVMGTPAYMPPEQASGRIAEIDERSDIYSLGAILYEILTCRPPFEGSSAYDVISKVLSENVPPPSERVTRVARPEAGGEGLPAVEDVPPELDEIVLKALSKDKELRYPTARALSEDIQLFLEGEKERERKRLEAEGKVEEGRSNLNLFREMAETIEKEEQALEQALESVKPWHPLDAKRPVWERKDRLRAMREERMEIFGNAEAAFGQAMASDPSNPGGRDGLCELYMTRFLAAEKREDREEMALFRNLLSKHDPDSRWLGDIEKPGALSLRTFTYPCNCLEPAKDPAWRVAIGVEPQWSWRDGRPLPGEEVGDNERPVPAWTITPAGARFGHSHTCERRELAGVAVWISRYEVREKRLIPQAERLLGTTPLEAVELERGSYLCILRHQGFPDVRLPVRIDRGGSWEQDVNLYRLQDVPEGFCYVPKGSFIVGRLEPGAWMETSRKTDDFFIARLPVLFPEYMEFLNDVGSEHPEEARSRQPREGDLRFLVEEGGTWRLPREGEENPLGLTERMPVMGVSWFDALAFCAWKSSREGRVYTLPHIEEHEKAGRGVDGRIYPWGDRNDGLFCNTAHSLEGGPRILEAGHFPADESLYGVVDLAGNVSAWALNAPEKHFRKFRVLGGGGWSIAATMARMGGMNAVAPSHASVISGIRLCCRPRAAVPIDPPAPSP